MDSTATRLSTFYSFFLKNIDPLIALGGAYLNFIDPASAVASMAPDSTYDPSQVFLFHQSGGLALAVAFLSAAVPRQTSDITIWRILQFSLFISDVAGLSGVGCALMGQGRWWPATWTSDDIACGGTYLFLTLLRLHFLLYSQGERDASRTVKQKD